MNNICYAKKSFRRKKAKNLQVRGKKKKSSHLGDEDVGMDIGVGWVKVCMWVAVGVAVW